MDTLPGVQSTHTILTYYHSVRGLSLEQYQTTCSQFAH